MPRKPRPAKRVIPKPLPPPNNPPVPLPNTPPPTSAGTAVWNVVELRSRLIDLLDDPRDLSSMLRTEKKGMALVAGKLYKSKTYKFVRSRISVSAPRRKMYLEAISEIDARQISLTPTMIQELHLDSPSPTSVPADGSEVDSDEDTESHSDGPSDDASDSGLEWDSETTSSEEGPESQPEPHVRRHRAVQAQERIIKWLESYHPELLDILVPYLRKRCPGVEKIIMGAEYQPFGTGFWEIKLDRQDVPSAGGNLGSRLSDSSAGKEGGGSGRIGAETHIGGFSVDHVHTLSFGDETPPTAKDISDRAPQPHLDSVATRSRFDLRLTGRYKGSSSSISPDNWRKALKETPVFGDLYKAVDFGRLYVDFDLLTYIYQRQIDVGHAERLEHIHAPKLSMWCSDAFRSFATIASTSLTRLILVDPSLSSTASIDTTLRVPAHSDFLPYFIHTVRHSLLSLAELAFGMEGIDDDEGESKDMLDEYTLSRRGTVTVLRVFTEVSTVAPFNLLRVLSPLLADGGATITLFGVEGDPEESHTQYIEYLRGHPPRRLRFLSTAQFPLLGFYTLSAVSSITFDSNGLPLHHLTTQLNAAIDKGLIVGARPLLLPAMRQLADATRYIVHRWSGAYSTLTKPVVVEGLRIQLLEQIQKQLSGIAKIMRVPGLSEDILATAEGAERDVKEAIRVMKVSVAADLPKAGA